MAGEQGEWPRKVGSGRHEDWGYGESNGWPYSEWAPFASGKVWFGTGVVGGLVDAIAAHIAATSLSRQTPIVIGCSPWLTDRELGAALAKLPCCIVMSKPDRSTSEVVRRLIREGTPVQKEQLDGLNLLALPNADGSMPLGISDDVPLTDEEWALHDVELGPVRLAGWRDRDYAPTTHAKVLVFAYVGEFPDAGPYGEDWYGVIPTSVWWGSANLTALSRQHLEFATWSNDRYLTGSAWRFITDVIALSEPFVDIPPASPTPQLVDATDPYDTTIPFDRWEPDDVDDLDD